MNNSNNNNNNKISNSRTVNDNNTSFAKTKSYFENSQNENFINENEARSLLGNSFFESIIDEGNIQSYRKKCSSKNILNHDTNTNNYKKETNHNLNNIIPDNIINKNSKKVNSNLLYQNHNHNNINHRNINNNDGIGQKVYKLPTIKDINKLNKHFNDTKLNNNLANFKSLYDKKKNDQDNIMQNSFDVKNNKKFNGFDEDFDYLKVNNINNIINQNYTIKNEQLENKTSTFTKNIKENNDYLKLGNKYSDQQMNSSECNLKVKIEDTKSFKEEEINKINETKMIEEDNNAFKLIPNNNKFHKKLNKSKNNLVNNITNFSSVKNKKGSFLSKGFSILSMDDGNEDKSSESEEDSILNHSIYKKNNKIKDIEDKNNLSNDLKKSNKNKKVNDSLWKFNGTNDKENIKDFWMCLSDENKKKFIKISKQEIFSLLLSETRACSCDDCIFREKLVYIKLVKLYQKFYKELLNIELEESSYHKIKSDFGVRCVRDYSQSLDVKVGLLSVNDNLLVEAGRSFMTKLEKYVEGKFYGRKGLIQNTSENVCCAHSPHSEEIEKYISNEYICDRKNHKMMHSEIERIYKKDINSCKYDMDSLQNRYNILLEQHEIHINRQMMLNKSLGKSQNQSDIVKKNLIGMDKENKELFPDTCRPPKEDYRKELQQHIRKQIGREFLKLEKLEIYRERQEIYALDEKNKNSELKKDNKSKNNITKEQKLYEGREDMLSLARDRVFGDDINSIEDVDSSDDNEILEGKQYEECCKIFQLYAVKIFHENVLEAYLEVAAKQKQKALIAEEEEEKEINIRRKIKKKEKRKKYKQKNKQKIKEKSQNL